MIYFYITITFLVYTFCDSGMDAIKDRRVWLRQHPFKDTWHVLKHISRLMLVSLGMLIVHARYDIVSLLICLFANIILFDLVWNFSYKRADFWFNLDETVKITTGIKWLDKMLGFHW